MRHTLLPASERKMLRNEYYVRLSVVACFMLAVAAIFCIIFLFPTFTRVAIEDRAQTTAAHALQKGTGQQSLARIEQEIALDNAMLAQVTHTSSATQFSSILYGIVTARNQGVTLNSFSFGRISSSTVTTTVQGTAVNREALVAYKNQIAQIAGNHVDLPYSELSKSADIQFSLKVTTTLP